jgi:hypothetical protein
MARCVIAFCFVSLVALSSRALDNGLAPTPPSQSITIQFDAVTLRAHASCTYSANAVLFACVRVASREIGFSRI